MSNLSSVSATLAVIEKYNFRFQKRYGQNFLIDANILDRIIEGAEITKDDCVLEIGPGIGTMTQRLAECAKKVIAVEIDKNLLPVLADTLSSYNNVTVINDDILKLDISGLSEKYNGGRPFKVVANLPYYITTPIIMELLEKKAPIVSITVMVQKEVADRMQTLPGSKDYGALSLAVRYYSEPEVITEVSKECFIPKPNVDSSVIRLKCHDKPPVSVNDEALMFRLIRAAFNQRRKTLVNAVGNDSSVIYSKAQTLEALKAMGVDESIRGERLSLAQFAELTNVLLTF